MKKFLSSAAAAFLIVAGSVTIGATAANATETYPVCTPSDAWTEVTPDIDHPAETHTVDHPAEYKDVLVTPAVEYQPAVYQIEYEFVHKHGQTKWSTNPNWNAENNDNSKGWSATGKTRNGALISAEVLAKDAVYDHQLVKDAWTETITDKAAWTEDVPDIQHPAVTCPPVKQYPPVITPVMLGSITAPTCDVDGSYSVEGLAAAENENGYEGDGFHFYVKNTTGNFGGPGIYTWEAYGIGASGNSDYPLGTSVGGKKDSQGNPKAGGKVTGSFEVLSKTGDCPIVVPEQPATTVTVATSEQKDCDADMVITTTTTTTSGRTEYNEYTNTWEPIEDLVVTDHSKREATAEECPTVVTPPEENKPPVVPQPETPVTPEKPVDEPKVALTSAEVVPTVDTLAQTGSEFNWAGPITGGALALAGIVLLVIRRFRTAHN